VEITGVALTFAPAAPPSPYCSNAARTVQPAQTRAEGDTAMKTSQQACWMLA
jgi:hypothetical protein